MRDGCKKGRVWGGWGKKMGMDMIIFHYVYVRNSKEIKINILERDIGCLL